MRFQLEYSVITVVQIYLLIHAHTLKMATSVVCGQPYGVLASLVLELHWRRGDVGGRECLSKTFS